MHQQHVHWFYPIIRKLRKNITMEVDFDGDLGPN
jgi:hypothetical protein